jgi:hypothetical protein
MPSHVIDRAVDRQEREFVFTLRPDEVAPDLDREPARAFLDRDRADTFGDAGFRGFEGYSLHCACCLLPGR